MALLVTVRLLELPPSVVLETIGTASKLRAPVFEPKLLYFLSTSLDIQVSEYLEMGEHIKAHTTNTKFISRA